MDSNIVYYVDNDYLSYFEYNPGDDIPDDQLFNYLLVYMGRYIQKEVLSIYSKKQWIMVAKII
jgi:hypothetical protein